MISWLIIVIMQLASMNLYITECNHKESNPRMFMPCEINVPSYLSITKRAEC